MPRMARELFPNQYYHLIARSNNHIALFTDKNDFSFYKTLVAENFNKAGIKCFHYILMNTHVHFVIKSPTLLSVLPKTMKIIHLKYYRHFSKKYSYVGSLWRGRYKTELIETNRYLLGCGLYIEYNAVRAGIVKLPEQYEWSSYRHWIRAEIDPFLSEHPLDEVKSYSLIATDYLESYKEYQSAISSRF